MEENFWIEIEYSFSTCRNKYYPGRSFFSRVFIIEIDLWKSARKLKELMLVYIQSIIFLAVSVRYLPRLISWRRSKRNLNAFVSHFHKAERC